jgi:hypothetical protein
MPEKVSYDFVPTVKRALAGLERAAVPPEDILKALTQDRVLYQRPRATDGRIVAE